MKILVNIVLFMFLSFLVVPTIVSILQDDDDISVSYNINEEEMHKEIKDVQLSMHSFLEVSFVKTIKKSTLIKSENLRRHDSVFGEIFSPPPEIV